ncbi:MAG: peptide-methionine (S)-S-oxide reductase MsrA [Nevskiales bacterium]|nr:peptide-methionine (S)-S-oxide reductase MsrA [Nevskiales bacterium]
MKTSRVTPEKATFAAGCFWGIEYKFSRLPGVITTQVGYVGGRIEHPTYEQVCTDRTGHAEAVQLEFDPAQIGYEQLVRFFFEIHNPTTRNRQGPDIGSQYRSAIFFHTPEQKASAARIIAELNKNTFAGGIVTELIPAPTFWPAEEYHQKYIEKQGGHGCAI